MRLPPQLTVMISAYTEAITIKELASRGQAWLNNRTCDLERMLYVYQRDNIPRYMLVERQLEKLYLAGGECPTNK